MKEQPSSTHRTLYDPRMEHDACGVGFVADIAGRPSHAIVDQAVTSVINLTHRGAVDADSKTGDGAGILTQIPRRLLEPDIARLDHGRLDPADIAVGMIFLPQNEAAAQDRARAIIAEETQNQGLLFVGWRVVPVNPSVLGAKAQATQPRIEQALISRPAGLDALAYERRLLLARKAIERRIADERIRDFYIPSFSCRTIVYKGLFVAPQLRGFYGDLVNPRFDSALAVFHQRYSTNTLPNWFLAQPFRMLAHNGEINTLQGNTNWMRARERSSSSPTWGDDGSVESLRPIIWDGGSDSSKLDNALEVIQLGGRDLLHSMAMMVPAAWENMPDMNPAWRAFYEYHVAVTEPWDGPAALAYSDGTIVAATLDRNGLRPARYKVTRDGTVIVASEVGTIDIPDEDVIEKGRLGPGQMIAVDTGRHLLLKDGDIKNDLSSRQPYGEWAHSRYFRLDAHATTHVTPSGLNGTLPRLQQVFGLTNEELKFVIQPMGVDGKEARWSMGDDAPLAVLSRRPRRLSHFFRQRFAQVTNPPIDPLREQLVMSLSSYVGNRGSIFTETPEHARLVHISHPVLLPNELTALCSIEDQAFQAVTLRALFPVSDGVGGLEKMLDSLCHAAEQAVADGKTIIVLSDRGVDQNHVPIPILLATSAVHHHLIRTGQRMDADIIVETGEAWDVHQFACLLGYGASAVCPYLTIESIRALVDTLAVDDLDAERAIVNFRKAIAGPDGGLLKVMSKMGISTLSSYRGAQIFEAIGLDRDLVEKHFYGTPSQLGGVGLTELAQDAISQHQQAFASTSSKLSDYGFYRFRGEGEYHDYNPRVVRALQKAADSGSQDDYRTFSTLVHSREPMTIRDLLRFKPISPIPIDEVEPVEAIRRRFTTQAMSLGALSPEAHSTISMAMNRIGGRSNTGEGGEDPMWYRHRSDGDSADNKTKQVASGRFGVTTEYLAHAFELEIKMAQGSKPGEGGELPGHKVTELIARLRHAVPGLPLISPPPHHDIYSIEDLAQLIYDLKQVNPRARVGVKLVSSLGVGTIAAGVAKAYADYVLISGHNGGTGASPLSSIKGAGCPWELGLAETQQVLVMNDLRGRITVRTDGGLKTGRDVVVAALLGAEEYGFGTASVVAIGCDMARQCHLNTCPTGIATQREDLRAKYTGKPEQLINYLTEVAGEVRVILAELGFRSLDEAIGRVDLLEQVRDTNNPRANLLDLSPIIAPADPTFTRPLRSMVDRNERHGDVPLDRTILADVAHALETGTPSKQSYPIRNSQRTVGAMTSGEIAHRYGADGLPEGTIDLTFTGSAGQSFGAFLAKGMRMTLIGEANDYVGKGMSGGEIVVRPPDAASFTWKDNAIVGNTVLYGATGGTLFVAGRVGERFCVRNSGALAVAEGAGDHCCEYMTAGVAVILGETGRNFGAGMTNGVAYVLDENATFERRYNPELVGIERLEHPQDIELLQSIMTRHHQATDSPHAHHVLANWGEYVGKFWKVVPHPAMQKAQATVLAGRHATQRNPAAGTTKA
jgi:glutamate synthase (ferredoxin)